MKQKLIQAGVALWIVGTALLFSNSEITDIALAFVSVGGLMTIWFKLGSLEATSRSLENNINQICTKLERLECRLLDVEKEQEKHAA